MLVGRESQKKEKEKERIFSSIVGLRDSESAQNSQWNFALLQYTWSTSNTCITGNKSTTYCTTVGRPDFTLCSSSSRIETKVPALRSASGSMGVWWTPIPASSSSQRILRALNLQSTKQTRQPLQCEYGMHTRTKLLSIIHYKIQILVVMHYAGLHNTFI